MLCPSEAGAAEPNPPLLVWRGGACALVSYMCGATRSYAGSPPSRRSKIFLLADIRRFEWEAVTGRIVAQLLASYADAWL